MKKIPDCPQGMGNANDWMQERERRGFPQNRTVSYEYTTYHSNDEEVDKILAEMRTNYEKIAELRYQEGKEEGYIEGYLDGYDDSLDDLKQALKTDLSSKSIKGSLEAEPIADISVNNRYERLLPVFKEINRLILNGIAPNLENLRKLCSN